MKILHTADIHIQRYGDERWNCLREIIETGKKSEVDILAISGDLFDKDVDAECLRPKIRGLFSGTGFKILIIPGNHDMNSYKNGMYFGDDVILLTDIFKPFEQHGVLFWGMPFESVDETVILHMLHALKEALPEDKVNILLFHGELVDTFFSRPDFGNEGEGRYMPVKLSYFSDLHLKYVLAGHFHSRFEVGKLGNEAYFVYPGSPISITRKETGQRMIHIVTVGEPPQEYPLSTPHYEEVCIDFDPFDAIYPLEILRERLDRAHPNAKIILTITGFIDGKERGTTETEIVQQIKEIGKGRCVEENFEFKDIQRIREDDLFKAFLKRLGEMDSDADQKKAMRDVVIKAMMGENDGEFPFHLCGLRSAPHPALSLRERVRVRD